MNILPPFTERQLTELREVLGDELLTIITDPGLASMHEDKSTMPLPGYKSAELLNACHGCFVGMTMAWDDIRKLATRWAMIVQELQRRELSGEGIGTQAMNTPMGRKPRPVRCVETGELYMSVAEAQKQTGLNVANAVYHGTRTGGYRFEWADTTSEKSESAQL